MGEICQKLKRTNDWMVRRIGSVHKSDLLLKWALHTLFTTRDKSSVIMKKTSFDVKSASHGIPFKTAFFTKR